LIFHLIFHLIFPFDFSSDFSFDFSQLKHEYLLLREQMDQKEKIIKELVSEKAHNSSFRANEDPKLKELESDLFILKKDNEELVKIITSYSDKDSEFTLKNLCNQNAQLRKKLYDVQMKLDSKQKNK